MNKGIEGGLPISPEEQIHLDQRRNTRRGVRAKTDSGDSSESSSDVKNITHPENDVDEVSDNSDIFLREAGRYDRRDLSVIVKKIEKDIKTLDSKNPSGEDIKKLTDLESKLRIFKTVLAKKRSAGERFSEKLATDVDTMDLNMVPINDLADKIEADYVRVARKNNLPKTSRLKRFGKKTAELVKKEEPKQEDVENIKLGREIYERLSLAGGKQLESEKFYGIISSTNLSFKELNALRLFLETPTTVSTGGNEDAKYAVAHMTDTINRSYLELLNRYIELKNIRNKDVESLLIRLFADDTDSYKNRKDWKNGSIKKIQEARLTLEQLSRLINYLDVEGLPPGSPEQGVFLRVKDRKDIIQEIINGLASKNTILKPEETKVVSSGKNEDTSKSGVLVDKGEINTYFDNKGPKKNNFSTEKQVKPKRFGNKLPVAKPEEPKQEDVEKKDKDLEILKSVFIENKDDETPEEWKLACVNRLVKLDLKKEELETLLQYLQKNGLPDETGDKETDDMRLGVRKNIITEVIRSLNVNEEQTLNKIPRPRKKTTVKTAKTPEEIHQLAVTLVTKMQDSNIGRSLSPEQFDIEVRKMEDRLIKERNKQKLQIFNDDLVFEVQKEIAGGFKKEIKINSNLEKNMPKNFNETGRDNKVETKERGVSNSERDSYFSMKNFSEANLQTVSDDVLNKEELEKTKKRLQLQDLKKEYAEVKKQADLAEKGSDPEVYDAAVRKVYSLEQKIRDLSGKKVEESKKKVVSKDFSGEMSVAGEVKKEADLTDGLIDNNIKEEKDGDVVLRAERENPEIKKKHLDNWQKSMSLGATENNKNAVNPTKKEGVVAKWSIFRRFADYLRDLNKRAWEVEDDGKNK